MSNETIAIIISIIAIALLILAGILIFKKGREGKYKGEVMENFAKLLIYRKIAGFYGSIPFLIGATILIIGDYFNYKPVYLAYSSYFLMFLLPPLIYYFVYKKRMSEIVQETKKIEPHAGKMFQFFYGFSDNPLKSFLILIIAVPLCAALIVLLIALLAEWSSH